MKAYTKSIKIIRIILTIIMLIPLSGCGRGLGGLLNNTGSLFDNVAMIQALQPSVPPESPANVQATDGTYFDHVAVTWNASDGATSYNVFRSDGSSYTQIAAGITGLQYDDTTVLSTRPFTYYLYKVIAVSSGGASSIDSSMTVPDQGYADPLSTEGFSPSGLTATDGTVVAMITVSWNAMTNANYYRLYKSSASGGPYTLEQDNISGITTNVNSAAGAAWWFRVSAVNANGETPQSLPDVGHAMGLPGPPNSITASDTSYHYADYIHVQWQAATGEGTILGYNIYGSDTAGGTYIKLNTSLISDLFYDETIPLEGKVRYYRVSTVNEAGTGAQSNYVSGQTWGDQPAAPTGVAATQGTYINKTTVTWLSSADADGYRIYRADTVSGTYTQLDDPGLVLTYDDTTGVQGYHYFYKVSALKTYGGESVQSNYAEGWILAPPDQVTGVSATDGTGYRQITITWLAPSGAVSSYNVYKSTASGGAYSLLASGITLLNYTDNSPDVSGDGIHRFYKVSAVNAAGEGAQSIYDEGNTMIAPAAPGSVSASDGSFDDRARITWTAPSGPVDSYNVYRCDDSSCTVGLITLATGVTALTYDDMIANHLTYYYMVSAVNDAGEGAVSATNAGSTNDVTPPASAPTGVTATQGDQVANIQVIWNSVTGAGWYNVYRSSTSGGVYTKINGSNITGLTYNDPTTAGVHWFYKVTAVNNLGETGLSSYAEGWAMLVAAQVTGVAASDGTSATSIAVSWNAVSDALHYHVFRSTTLSGTYTMIADNITLLGYTDSSGLDATHHWYYKVSAVNPAGEGAQSAADGGWVIVSAPTSISASQGTYDDSIRISWNASVGATGYNVYSSTTQSGVYTKITSSPVAASPYDDPDMLIPGHYWYKVTAVNGDGEGGYSASAEGWPLDDSGTIGTPANVVATQGSFTNKVTITWNAAAEAAYYNVYRSATANGTYAKMNGLNITATTYDDSTVSCAIHYFYRVTAVNEHGTESGQSAYSEGWAAPLWTNPPTNISATDGTQAGQITITWTATSGADFYNVYRSSTSGGTYTKVNSSNITATTYTNTGIAAGAHWFYKVTANSLACSAESIMSAYNEGFALPIPDVPSGVTATDKANAGLESAPPRCNTSNPSNGIDGVTITWSASSYAASYNVYRSDPAYDGSGTYGAYTKINTLPITGTLYLDDYGTWDRNPATFRRLINVYRYKVTAVNAAGESAQSSYDEGSAQVTTAEFFGLMYDMAQQYAVEKMLYKHRSSLVPPITDTIAGEFGGQITWNFQWNVFLFSVYSDITWSSICDYKYSSDYSSYYIYTNSIHNFKITLNGMIRGNLDTNGNGWADSTNSSHSMYCSTPPCSEPPAPYWPSPSYLQYLTVISVDADCYGWVLEHAHIYQKTTRVDQGNDWVSYRGQRPIRMDKTSLTTQWNETSCP